MYILCCYCIFGCVWEWISCGIVWLIFEIVYDNKLFCGQFGGGRYFGGCYFYFDLDFNVILFIWR